MPKENVGKINRRTLLNTVGSTTIVGTLGANRGLANSGRATTSRVNAISNTKKVQTLVETFDGLSIDETEAQRLDISDDKYRYDVTRAPTTVGELTYIERNDGVEEATLLMADGESENSAYWRSRHDLPEQYRRLPTDVNVSYIAGEGGEALFRAVTREERNAVAKAVEAEPDSVFAWTFDKAPGIQVIVEGDERAGDSYGAGYQIIPAGGIKKSTSGPTSTPQSVTETYTPAQITGGEFNEFGQDDVVTFGEWDLTECLGVCKTCLTAAYGCYKCAGFCAAGVSGIGIVACAVCLVGLCGATAGSCYLCADNCSHHVPHV